MDGVNKVMLIGHVGSAPEHRVKNNPGSTVQVTKLSLATTKSFKDKNTGQRNKKTEWHEVVFFSSLAEIVSKLVRKGSKLFVEGELRTNEYTTKDGVKKKSTQVHGLNFLLLDSKKQDGNVDGNTKSYSDNAELYSPSGNTMVDDDIPF